MKVEALSQTASVQPDTCVSLGASRFEREAGQPSFCQPDSLQTIHLLVAGQGVGSFNCFVLAESFRPLNGSHTSLSNTGPVAALCNRTCTVLRTNFTWMVTILLQVVLGSSHRTSLEA